MPNGIFVKIFENLFLGKISELVGDGMYPGTQLKTDCIPGASNSG